MPSNVVSIESGDRAGVLRRRDELVEANLDLVQLIAGGVKRNLPKSFELEDLIATGYLALIRAATRYRPAEYNNVPFDAYARPVIRGAIIDSVRRGKYVEQTRPSVDGLVDGLPDHPHPPVLPECDETIDRRRVQAKVRRAVAELPARTRQVIDWHYADEIAFPEVGRRLNVTRSRASQIHRGGIRRLRSDPALAELSA